MNTNRLWFLLVLTSACLMGLDAAAHSPKDTPTLVGTWDYTSMAVLTNGRPSGTVHFKPGQWTVTFNQDGTWVMKPPSVANPHGLNGTYEIHGHDLDMKLADGKPYYKYHFKIEQDGKVLTLKTKDSAISAVRE